MSFYIQKIIVSGKQKSDSTIEFSNGLNIIYGPSNTGKTMIVNCIDYMFGSDNNPIDLSTGYEQISIIIKTDSAKITMCRKIGENKINVTCSNESVLSGYYSITTSRKNYNKTINSIWLSLIGIPDMHLIISNENFKKQILSWRTFYHMFVLTETNIISGRSPILSENYTSNTAIISSLIFLLTGNDFSESETKESKAIKEAKKAAIKSYINKELFKLSERNQELTQKIKDISENDIHQELETLMSRISEYEKSLNKSLADNKNILSQLHEKNEALSECSVLLNRYSELATQYASDLKRLNFIVDGEVNSNASIPSICPFCDGKIVVNKNEKYLAAAKAEYKKIKLQSQDLEKAIQELYSEKTSLEKEIALLMSNKKATEDLIENEIKPQLGKLKDKLSSYKMLIESQKEIDILKKLAKAKEEDISFADSENDSVIKFKVKDHLDYSFVSNLAEEIKHFLEDCQFANLLSVIFDKNDMDIVINGKKKSSNGKGYNAYFNSIMAIVLSRYMKNHAHFSPNFLILDSPILSLKENETKKPTQTMRCAMFKNLIDNQSDIQTIIIENDIPKLDYSSANLIHFTKEKNNDRYGFLNDITD